MTANYAVISGVTLAVVVVAALMSAMKRRAPRESGRFLVLTLVAALLTAFFSYLAVFRGQTLGGWLLLGHTLVSPLLILALLLEALFHPIARDGWRAVADAALMTLGALTIGSMLFRMFPWFGEEGMERLLQIHRYAALGLLALVLLRAGGAWPAMTQRRETESRT